MSVKHCFTLIVLQQNQPDLSPGNRNAGFFSVFQILMGQQAADSQQNHIHRILPLADSSPQDHGIDFRYYSKSLLLDLNILNAMFQDGGDDFIPGTIGNVRNFIQFCKQILPDAEGNNLMAIVCLLLDPNRFVIQS